MKNEIANIKSLSDEQIRKITGQDEGLGNGINIPRLGINRSPEDDDGNQLPVGHFFTYDKSVGQNVFGKPVTFRPFISMKQYMHYDPEKSEYVNRSIMFINWKEEVIDILGGTKCGKVPFKERSSLTPEQLAEQRTIRCYRLLYGLLSFKGKKANGEDHEVDNLPVLWRVTGTAFSPVSIAENQMRERNKHPYTCTFSLESKRQKKGGNVYYIPEISVNADANLMLSKKDTETLMVFQGIINKENDEVVELYKAARKGQSVSSDGESAKLVKKVEDPIEVLSS